MNRWFLSKSPKTGNRRVVPRSATHRSHASGGRETQIVYVGLDFGTTATKVAFRTNEDRVRLVPLKDAEKSRQRMFLTTPRSKHDVTLSLKMELLDGSLDETTRNSVRVDTTAFLTDVLERVRDFVTKEVATARGSIAWFVTIGVPVAFKKTSSEQKLLAVLDDACRNANLGEYQAQAMPEIEAALSAFTASPEIGPGVYAAVDVGGGTTDISMFSVRESDGGLTLDFVNGDVRNHGAERLKHVLREELRGNKALRALRWGDRESSSVRISSTALGTIVEGIRRQLATVVVNNIATWHFDRHPRQKQLPVFLIGGGSRIKWYQSVVAEVYKNRRLDRAGVPEMVFDSPRVPRGFELGASEKDLDRLMVAHGLTYPHGGRAQVVSFPTQHSDEEYRRPIVDGQEILDQRALDGYGETI